ncbi:MAG: hypothetical protein ACW99F_18075 [Candidatus Hodarchaeales archaeon]|jgi:hypothetical protein
MTNRRYRTQWHRYCTSIGVILIALGGLIMLLYGVIGLVEQTTPNPFLLISYISLDNDINFLLNLVSILAGLIILVITARKKAHEKKTAKWLVIAFLLAILGGTLGGLISFGGILIYFIAYFL